MEKKKEMCDALVSSILTTLSDLPLNQYVLPPIVFTTDLDCNGTMYTSNDLVIKDTDTNKVSIGDNYTSYDNMSTIQPLAFTNTDLYGKSLFLPRKYIRTLNTLTNVYTTITDIKSINPYDFRSVIIPPQVSKVEIEGIIGLYYSDVFNNFDNQHRFRYTQSGPSIISNSTSLKYQELLDDKDVNASYLPMPAYYMSDRRSSMAGIYFRDLEKLGYNLNTFGLGFLNSGVLSMLHRMNIKETQNVETLIRRSCMGDLLYFGGKVIDRYVPQGPFCDAYMRNYCSTHQTEEACGCFRDEEAVLTMSETRNVALPVKCYGVHCASENSYKTLAMKQIPCNRMLCKQEINGIVDAGENVITCNGSYYSHDGQVKLLSEYYNAAAATEDPAKLEQNYESKVKSDRLESSFTAQPIYVWICLAMAYLIIIVFAIFYLFPPSFFRTVSSLQ